VGPDHKPTTMIKRLAALLVLALGLAGAGEAAGESPEQVIGRLNEALLATMQAAGQGLDYQDRFERLAPVLEETFAFPAMTRLAVGPGWREIAPERRDAIEALFREMSIANFAARFDGYDGERFEVLGSEAGPRDAVLVKSRIVRPDEPPVGLDYLLRESEGDWRIIDVFLDSKFSELARQRAEFAAVLRSGGAEELISTLERKIEELAG